MLIPGENVMVFVPHGYGFAVFIGHVETETPMGWIVNPARTIEQINPADASDSRWIELANGDNKLLRADCKYGTPIKGGIRIPLGCASMIWHGDLPK